MNRNNKQLDKFKKEGASASGALQSKMDEQQKELDEANEKISGAFKERDDALAQMEEKTKQMEAMKSLADSSTALQKELEVSYGAIGEQEKKFQDRIVTLRKQLEVAERKVRRERGGGSWGSGGGTKLREATSLTMPPNPTPSTVAGNECQVHVRVPRAALRRDPNEAVPVPEHRHRV